MAIRLAYGQRQVDNLHSVFGLQDSCLPQHMLSKRRTDSNGKLMNKFEYDPDEEDDEYGNGYEDDDFTDPDQDRFDVADSVHQMLKTNYPELYGLMLMANQRILAAGSRLIWFAILGVLGLSVGIHMEWFPEVFGLPVEKLQSWWVYLLIVLAGFLLNGLVVSWLEKIAWARFRDVVHKERRKQNISVPVLLTWLEDNIELSRLAQYLQTGPVDPHG